MMDNGVQEQMPLLIDTTNCRNVNFIQMLELARRGAS